MTLFLTGMSAFLLSAHGFLWGSRVAPAIGALTLLALLFVPRDRAGHGRSTAPNPGRR